MHMRADNLTGCYVACLTKTRIIGCVECDIHTYIYVYPLCKLHAFEKSKEFNLIYEIFSDVSFHRRPTTSTVVQI